MSAQSSNGMPTDREMMKYLVGYVTGKPFPFKHTVMDVDDRYGIRVFTPSQIFESTIEAAAKKNIRYLITFQNLKKAKAVPDAPGIWKSAPKLISISDANNRRMGTVKNSCYYYYYYNKEKASLRIRRSEWRMREYYLSSKYLPLSKVDRKKVLISMIIKKGSNTDNNNNNNNNQGGKSKSDDDEMMMEGQNDVVSTQHIMQSLQALQLQHSSN